MVSELGTQLPWHEDPMRSLCERLAAAYSSESRTRQLVASVKDFPDGRVAFERAAHERWTNVLDVAAAAGRFGALMERVLEDRDVAGYHGLLEDDLRALERSRTKARVVPLHDRTPAVGRFHEARAPAAIAVRLEQLARDTLGELFHLRGVPGHRLPSAAVGLRLALADLQELLDEVAEASSLSGPFAPTTVAAARAAKQPVADTRSALARLGAAPAMEIDERERLIRALERTRPKLREGLEGLLRPGG